MSYLEIQQLSENKNLVIFAKLSLNFNSNSNWGCVDFISNFSNHSTPPHPHQKSSKAAEKEQFPELQTNKPS